MKFSSFASTIVAALSLASTAIAAPQQANPSEVTTIYSTIVHTVTVLDGSKIISTTIPLTTETKATTAPIIPIHSHITALYAAALDIQNSTSSSLNNTSTLISSTVVPTAVANSTILSHSPKSTETAGPTKNPSSSSSGTANSGVQAVQLSSAALAGALIGLTLNLF